MRDVDSGSFGILMAAMYISIYTIAKAIIEAGYFHDRPGAGRTLSRWLFAMTALAFAFGMAKLYNDFG